MKSETTADRISAGWTALHAARLHVCQLLALVASDPRSERWERLRDDDLLFTAQAAAGFLSLESSAVPAELAPGERATATLDLVALVGELRAPHEELVAEYDRVFGLVSSKECPTYETDYCPQTFSVYRSQQLADVAGYYAAFGLQPSRDVPERPDHVALEIEFLAWLLAKERHALASDHEAAAEQAAVCRNAQESFVRDHLSWWLPAFARALARKTDSASGTPVNGYLAEFARVLPAWVPIERAILGVEPPTELAAPNPGELDEMGCASCDHDPSGIATSQPNSPAT